MCPTVTAIMLLKVYRQMAPNFNLINQPEKNNQGSPNSMSTLSAPCGLLQSVFNILYC